MENSSSSEAARITEAMALAAEIKTVAADDSLNDDEKVRKVREALFG